MSNRTSTDDPVILEIQKIREKIRQETQGLNAEELSRWYQVRTREVEERYYGTNAHQSQEDK